MRKYYMIPLVAWVLMLAVVVPVLGTTLGGVHRQVDTLTAQVTSLHRQVTSLQAARRVTTTAAPACPVTGAGPYVSCIRLPDTGRPDVGQQITMGSGSDPGTPWQVTDHQGAPVAWVNLFGMYSGGDGGLMPGGLICVTYSVTSNAACLTPEGDLQLQATGPHGPVGPVVTLTPADIRWIHRHGG